MYIFSTLKQKITMEDSFNEEGHNVPKNQNPSNEVHLSYDI